MKSDTSRNGLEGVAPLEGNTTNPNTAKNVNVNVPVNKPPMSKTDEINQSLQNTLMIANETLGIGIDTAKKLDEQEEQLKNIHNNARTINSEVDKSSKTLKKMNRSIFNPKTWFG